MRSLSIALFMTGCAQTFIPFSEVSRNRSSAILEQGQAQIAASAGGVVNELGQGNGFEQIGAQLGLGQGLELSLSGYDVGTLTRGFCGAECAARVGMMLSSDKPELPTFQKYSLAGELGFAVGGGVACTPLPPPLGPFEVECKPRPTFYSTDFGVVLNGTPHHDVSPYAALGGQWAMHRNPELQKIQHALWFRSAVGLELSFRRTKIQLEGGTFGIGLDKDTFQDPGRLLNLYYLSTGLRFVIGKPPKLATTQATVFIPTPKPPPKKASTRTTVTVTPAKQPASQPASQPAPQPSSQPMIQAPIPWAPE